MLTSQLQEMQKQMNSVNYSGEFQDVESNYSGDRFQRILVQELLSQEMNIE